MARLICQVCGADIGDRPVDVAPGPRGQLWYVHRDPADCERAIKRVNPADLVDVSLIAGLIASLLVFGWTVLNAYAH